MSDKTKEKLKKLGALLKKKMKEGHKNSRWIEVMELLVSAITLTTYCAISPILAEYHGKKAVYWTASSVIILLLVIAFWKFICLIKYKTWEKFFSSLFSLLKKTAGFIPRWFHAPRSIFILLFAVIMGTCIGIFLEQFHTTEYYASIMEVYGIPVGVGAPLSTEKPENCTDYWIIEEYPLRRTIIVTHENAFDEQAVMEDFSSIYNMAFFQPVDRMVYKYGKNKEKFRALNDEKSYLAAVDNSFREPREISYFDSHGKLLLHMQKEDASDTFAILTYSMDSAPQLFNSTLLRIPEKEADLNEKQERDEIISRNAIGASILSQKIEVTYNSDGLPDTRRISPHIYNLYGVNGERYEYNQNRQLTALYYLDTNGNPICNQKGIMTVSFEYDENDKLAGIRYFSDENKEEKIEGFHGVFCEKFEYDADGNLCVRKQLNQNENRWYDKNGVCEYRYTYVGNRLAQEEFLDFSGNKTNNQNVNSSFVKFNKVENDKKNSDSNTVITVSLDTTIRLAEEVPSEPKTDRKPDILSVMSEQVSTDKEKHDGKEVNQDKNGAANDSAPTAFVNETKGTETVDQDISAPSERTVDDSSTTEETNIAGENTSQIDMHEEELPVRNYTKVCYTVNKKDNVLHVSYYNENGRVRQEDGFSAKEIRYDNKFRLKEKTYLDENNKPCLTINGYAKVFFEYVSNNGDEKRLIEYRNAKNNQIINTKDGYANVVYESSVKSENPYGDTTITLEYHDQNMAPICLPEKGYSKIKQTYNNRGLLIREAYYKEESGKEVPACRTDYMVAGIEYEYADDGNPICAIYKDATGQTVNRYDTGYAMKFQEYENGNLVKIHFQGYINNVLQDVPSKKYGIGSIRYIYANGHPVEEHYFDINGIPTLRSDIGCAVLKKEYNNRGLIAARSYYGTDDELILRKSGGYASVRYQYDELGRIILLHYFGVDQMPVISTADYCAGIQYQYDRQGNRSDIRYLDANNNLMNRRDLGYARISKKYNADRKIVEERYFDSEGHPVERKKGGYALYKAAYEKEPDKEHDKNPIKTLVKIEYRDRFGNLVMHTETGYACASYIYVGDKCTWELFFDKYSQPVISKKYHCAGFHYEYNTEENQKTIVYLDLHGEPLIRSDLGYAQVCKQYDDLGYLIREDYYAADEEQTPILCKEGGYASFENQYDENGNCVRNIYRDIEGSLTLRKDIGCAVIENDYDNLNRCIRVSYYGTDYKFNADEKYEADDYNENQDMNKKALVFHATHGCAGFLYHYDETGNRTDISYLDTNGNVMTRRDLGFARVHMDYDGQGNLVAEKYFDVNNNPTTLKKGEYASFKKTYQNDKCIEAVYYDTDDKPVFRKDHGAAIERWQYDEFGQCVSRALFDTSGNPVISKTYMCAAFTYEYDSRGNRTDVWFRDRDGKIMVRPDLGYAHQKNEYDNRGNLVKRSYYDVEGRLALSKENGIAYFENQFDDNDNWAEGRYYGKNRELKIRKDSDYARCKNIHNKYGQQIAIYFYGTDGATPILGAQRHCAGILYEYDEMGEKTATKYLGTDAQVMKREDLGYAQEKITTTYDSQTNKVKKTGYFLDRKGNPTAAKKGGYTSYENIYVCGKCVENRYYAEDSQRNRFLTVRDDTGYAKIEKTYDRFGQCSSDSYYDIEDTQEIEENPVYCLEEENAPGTRLRISQKIAYEYDEKGNAIDVKYENAYGNIIFREDLGYAQMCREYDEQGNITEERYYDDNHKPAAVISGGYFSMDWVYSDGNCTEIRYYDAEKKLMLRGDENYAIQRNQYDEYGRCILTSFNNADGEPVINTRYDCAIFEYKYDQLANMTDAIYRDEKGAMMVRRGLGFAWIHKKYDEWDRAEVETYYDAEQNPTINVNGYAGIRYEYSEQGTVREIPFDLNAADLFNETEE